MYRSLFIPLCTSVLCAAAAAQDPSYYLRRDTWQRTAEASLAILATQRGGAAEPQEPIAGPWSSVGPFRATGKDAFAEVFPPETERLPAQSYTGGSLRWTPRPEWRDGTIVMFAQTDFCAMFLARTLKALRDTTLALSLGSDDGIKVWLDGRLLLAHDVTRGVRPDQEELDLPLSAGDHRLLVKVNNGQGEFGFTCSVVDRPEKEIFRLIARDFPSEASRREVAWETEDSIWSSPWSSEAELARRYASATPFERPAERAAAIERARTVKGAQGLEEFRSVYLGARQREATPVILTPLPSPLPRIHGARIFGARPGNPFLFSVSVTGDRPIRFSASGLPPGLSLDSATGRISGVLKGPGRYTVTLEAHNAQGRDERPLIIVGGPDIALTPPLGWNSWNCFASDVDDAKVRAAADAMVRSGLADHGWSYINIDDCWEIKPGSRDTLLAGEPRSPGGMINTNRKFPDMADLAAYVHGRGLKFGIYSSPGPLTCAGFTASYRYESQDAEQYARWGVDYLKYDWCSYGSLEKTRTREAFEKPYRVMRRALDGVHRDIIFSLCQYGMGDVWEWGGEVGGNSWRTTGDIEDTWESMSGKGFSQAGHEAFAKPGNWNDPDMLVVGKVGWGPELHPSRLTPGEQYTHISLWALLCSPLLIGCDMTQMDQFTLSLLTNDEVLDVNQDPLGRQASKISARNGCEVWAKQMEDGSRAVGLFNRGRYAEEITVSWAELGLGGELAVRDLWRQKDLGRFTAGVTLPVPRHGVMLLRVGPAAPEPSHR